MMFGGKMAQGVIGPGAGIRPGGARYAGLHPVITCHALPHYYGY